MESNFNWNFLCTFDFLQKVKTMYVILVFFHIVFATIWIGGHGVILFNIFPLAYKKKDPQILLGFENLYEKIGIPSLILQVITGLFLFLLKVETWDQLLNWNDYNGRHFLLKMLLLLITILFAIHARFRIIPNLTNKTLLLLGLHIFGVFLLSLGFLLVGISIRFNLFF